jgi:hypothetical protein
MAGEPAEAGSGGSGTLGGTAGLPPGGNGGTAPAIGGEAGGGTDGGSAGAGMGGASGAGTGAGGTIGAGATAACPDLDLNGTPDCEETLASNSDFDKNAEGWSNEATVNQVWNQEDARRVTDSGSIRIHNAFLADFDTVTMNGSWQCRPVEPVVTYRYVAEVFVQGGQSPSGSGALHLIFYDGNDCSGTITGSALDIGSVLNAWQVLEVKAPAPPGSHSARLRLVAMKPMREQEYRVQFDNVLFRQD